MKRIPKGTLKVTTSDLDGLPAHEKSKRPQFQKKEHPSTKTPKSIRSFASPSRTRIPDSQPVIVTPSSPLPSAFSQTSGHSFQFLRRPFGGSSSLYTRKSSTASKRLQQIGTCGSSDTSSSNSSGMLGIAAPPSNHDVQLIDPADESIENVSSETILMDERQLCSTHSIGGSPQTSGDATDLSPRGQASSPSSPVHAHLLGIARPSYKMSGFETGEMKADEDELAKLYEEQESEIVFECSPDSSCSKRDKFTLFEQSWLSDSDEDIQLEREQRSPGHQRHRVENRRVSPDNQRPDIGIREPGLKASTVSTPDKVRSPFSTRTRTANCKLPIWEGSKQSSPSVFESATRKDAGEKKNEDTRADLGDQSESVKIFVLLLQPSDKIFELIQLTYPREGTTLGSILEMIPGNATEAVLASQSYIGITRPRKRSPDFCDRTLTVSDPLTSSSNYHSIGLEAGEIVIALPKGFSHYELVRLAKKILSNERIQSLLERSSARIGKKSKPASPTVTQKSRERKDCEESVKRAMAVASVANAVVQSQSMQVPSRAKASSKDQAPQRRSLQRFQDEGASSFTPFPSLSLRQRQAIKGIAMLSSASSVSSSSSRSAASQASRSIPSKKRVESLLGTTQPLSSSTSVSSSTLDASAIVGISTKNVDLLEPAKRPEETLILRRFDRTKVANYPRASVLARIQPEIQAQPSPSTIPDTPGLQRGPEPSRPTVLPSSVSSVASSTSHTSSTARYSPPNVKATKGSVETSKSVASECSSADRSVRSYLSRRSVRSQIPRPDSFASFTQRSVYGSTSRVHRQRKRAAFASTLTWGLALLCMTIILRYYTDPTGYQAITMHRNYDQPLGLLGGLQLFLLMHMLIKFQHSYLSGRIPTDIGHETRLRTPNISRRGGTPLLHRQRGTRL
jgi:hypothetical protein